MKTVLITGATGFVGPRIVTELCPDYRVIALVRPGSDISGLPQHKHVFVVRLGQKALEDIFSESKPSSVINAAVCYGIQGESLEAVVQANVLFPLELVRLSAAVGCKAFFNIDSFYSKSYMQYKRLIAYQLSKQHLMDWLTTFATLLPVINVRLEHVYGPGDRPQKLISALLKKIVNKEERIALTPGQQRRDFVYVDDVARAFRVLLENTPKPAGIVQTFEVGTGRSYTLSKFLCLAKELSGSPTYLDFGALPYIDGEIMESKADTKLLEALGWKAGVSLNDGLIRLLEALK